MVKELATSGVRLRMMVKDAACAWEDIVKQAVNMRRFRPDGDLVAVAAAQPGTTVKHDPATAGVTLYTIPPSLCSQRVRMTLFEKDVPFAEHSVNTAAGENLTPEYIALNPRALVPTMTFDNRVLFDSATMMRFIDNWFVGPELAPAGVAERAAMDVWIDRSDDFPVRGFTYRAHLASGLPDYWRVGMHDNIVRARELYPEHRDLYDLKLADWRDLVAWMDDPGDAVDGEAIAARLADDAEAALAMSPFLVGDALTLADISVFILLMRLQCGCNVDLWSATKRPAVRRWIEALKRRPSYDGAVLAPYRGSRMVQVEGDCWLPLAHAA